MTFWKWSTNAAINATADSTCPFPEGMAPSALNDGARGVMAAAAKYRDDIAGIIVTAGTATAYSIFSNQGFDKLEHLHGAMICFTPHVTNGANGTSLNVDGLGVKPILTAPGVGLPGAVLVQGTPYAVTYNNTDGAFYLHGYFNAPYNVPLFGGMDYWDTVAPNSSFIFPLGQAISRTTYAAAFARWGTTYGPGDGTTTFNVPNKAGRVSAMIDASGAVLTSATMTPDGGTMGAKGGGQLKTLVRSDLPNVTAAVAISDPGHAHQLQNGQPFYLGAGTATPGGGGATTNPANATLFTGVQSAQTGITASLNLNGNVAQTNVNGLPPTIACNYIIRII